MIYSFLRPHMLYNHRVAITYHNSFLFNIIVIVIGWCWFICRGTMNPFIQSNKSEWMRVGFRSNTRPGIELWWALLPGPVFIPFTVTQPARVWNCIIRQGSVHLTRHVFSLLSCSVSFLHPILGRWIFTSHSPSLLNLILRGRPKP